MRPRLETLGNPRELFEVRLSFFNKGVLTLLRLVAHIIQQRGIACEIEETHLAVAVSIERRLETAQGQRAVLENFARPLLTDIRRVVA